MSAGALETEGTPRTLPTSCPDWCDSQPKGHRQALTEGCTSEQARIHTSADLVGRTVVDDEAVGWGLWLKADPGPTWFGPPFLELETHRRSDGGWSTTCGA